jgi:predicted RNA-binding protein YlxR (DUF448 family)
MKQDRKETMVRIAGDGHGVKPDFDGQHPGRGGYLHPRDECLAGFLKSRAREFKSLRLKIDREQRASIIRAIRERLDRKLALE